MKLAVVVSTGQFGSFKFESSEHETIRDCAVDLVNQMRPIAVSYPTVKAKMDEVSRAYGV
jgi:hypothetical protein